MEENMNILKLQTGESCYTEYNDNVCEYCGYDDCFGCGFPDDSPIESPTLDQEDINTKKTYIVWDSLKKLYEHITSMLTEYSYDH